MSFSACVAARTRGGRGERDAFPVKTKPIARVEPERVAEGAEEGGAFETVHGDLHREHGRKLGIFEGRDCGLHAVFAHISAEFFLFFEQNISRVGDARKASISVGKAVLGDAAIRPCDAVLLLLEPDRLRIGQKEHGGIAEHEESGEQNRNISACFYV